jgi:hypothetical protein
VSKILADSQRRVFNINNLVNPAAGGSYNGIDLDDENLFLNHELGLLDTGDAQLAARPA